MQILIVDELWDVFFNFLLFMLKDPSKYCTKSQVLYS